MNAADILSDIQFGIQLAPYIIQIIASIEQLFPQPKIGPAKLELAKAITAAATGQESTKTDPLVTAIATPFVAAMKAQAA